VNSRGFWRRTLAIVFRSTRKANPPRGGGAKPRASGWAAEKGDAVARSRKPRADEPPDEAPRFEDSLRRVSVVLIANLGPAGLGYAADRAALSLRVAAAGASILGALLFPWRRHDRNLFLVASAGGLLLIAAAVFFSGGGLAPSSRSTSSPR
jgi:hypothetical protein